MSEPKLCFSIDRGGTFTDVFCQYGGEQVLSDSLRGFWESPSLSLVHRERSLGLAHSARH